MLYSSEAKAFHISRIFKMLGPVADWINFEANHRCPDWDKRARPPCQCKNEIDIADLQSLAYSIRALNWKEIGEEVLAVDVEWSLLGMVTLGLNVEDKEKLSSRGAAWLGECINPLLEKLLRVMLDNHMDRVDGVSGDVGAYCARYMRLAKIPCVTMAKHAKGFKLQEDDDVFE